MKKGFTLAEVLLTLTIIGVVASLTIPAVITKVQQDQYVAGLKKAYNALKSVEREAIQEYGPMENWDWTDTQVTFNKYFRPYFDVLKDCGTATDGGCFATNIKNLDGSEPNYYKDTTFLRFIASDGISFGYKNPAGLQYYKGDFIVDVNGPKIPNINGRDVFVFNLFTNHGIKPQGSYSSTGAVRPSVTSTNLCTSSNSESCTSRVLSEGAMNY